MYVIVNVHVEDAVASSARGPFRSYDAACDWLIERGYTLEDGGKWTFGGYEAQWLNIVPMSRV